MTNKSTFARADIAESLRHLFKEVDGHCEAHGAFVAHVHKHVTTPDCPTCKSMREESERRAADEEAAQERRERALDRAQLMGRNRDQTFGTFEASDSRQQLVLKACRDFADNFSADQGAGLWLIGPPGVGKSHLACAIAQAVIFQRKSRAIYATARGIVRALRDTWRRDSDESEEDVITRFGEVDLLVLDEVGVGFGTEHELTQLFDVVDRRYALELPTVLISNLTVKDIKASLGERLYERLLEGSTIVPCEWKSHRRRGPVVKTDEGATS